MGIGREKGYKHSEKTKIKISESCKGRIPWNKGIARSEKTKIKISESKSGKNHPNYGKHLSEETKQKISKAQKGKIHKGHITLRNLRKGKTYEEIFGVEKAIEIKRNVKSKLKGRNVWNKGLTADIDNRILSKENHGGWNGGTSNKPYPFEFNSELKYRIFKRDSFRCQLCDIHNPITVHHINYNKKNISDRNLITLCNRHNLKANFERNKWELFYTILNHLRGI